MKSRKSMDSKLINIEYLESLELLDSLAIISTAKPRYSLITYCAVTRPITVASHTLC